MVARLVRGPPSWDRAFDRDRADNLWGETSPGDLHVCEEPERVFSARSADADLGTPSREELERRRHGHVVRPEARKDLRAMSMSRARSWPLLEPGSRPKRGSADVESRIVEAEKRGVEALEEKNSGAQNGSPQVQARRLLCRHYYTEGGWGWVVTVVGTLVHLLGPGLQLSIPATLARPATVKFYHHPLHTAGELSFDLRSPKPPTLRYPRDRIL
ncbi:hypothetical protein KM043_004175 [Ampulex compressa]|nr:hypothetical protein KM043_004175 [Ampulex compressa]